MNPTYRDIWYFIDPDEFEEVLPRLDEKTKQKFKICEDADDWVYEKCSKGSKQYVDPGEVEAVFPEPYQPVPDDEIREILKLVSYKFHRSKKAVRMDGNLGSVEVLDCISAYERFGLRALKEILDKGSIYLKDIQSLKNLE